MGRQVDNAHGEPFVAGDRVLVGGGYDQHPEWDKEGHGYSGTISCVGEHWAVVELDEDLQLEIADTASGGWRDFGRGSYRPLRQVSIARGRWLALALGWVGEVWKEPIGRLHVDLCDEVPDVSKIPRGGGIGVWVESHATMKHLRVDGGS